MTAFDTFTDQLNQASREPFTAAARRHLRTLALDAPSALAHAALQATLAAAASQAWWQVVRASGREPQLALIRAHPELAGKAMVSQTLTAESTNEQGKAGLTACTPTSSRASSSSQRRATTRASAFPSSWRCAARAARV
jgi:N-carbamoyl-L-amino-acid hydrolase